MCRLKAAGLPARHDLDRYDFTRTEGIDSRKLRELRDDFTRTEGIDSRKLRELRELVWVGQAYNLLRQAVPEQERPILPPDLSMRR